MEKALLVFIPLPDIGHLVSEMEAAKLLLTRHPHLSISVLILDHSFVTSKVHHYIQSQQASSFSLSNRLQIIYLPKDETELFHFTSFFERKKPHVKDAVLKVTQSELTVDSPKLASFVIDMWCTPMIDVAHEFGVPCYIFYPANAASLGFMLHVQKIHDEDKFDLTEFKNSDAELQVPSLVNPVPVCVMPPPMLSRETFLSILDTTRRFREAKGIMVNTFFELESHAIESLKMLPVYPVGPILNVGSNGRNINVEIIQWLDNQPVSSVVFLCFGSMGSFGKDQVKEIACALELNGHRFLWSLRRPPSEELASPSDYEDPQEVLPDGFLGRTAEIGKVIGWAPQVDILGHPAIGGFVSHCGWNSVLESIWFGVPIATWPIYAEQQFNAFEMVKELGLAVEITMDYRNESGVIVKCEEIERGIRCLMEHDSDTRKKVKDMSEKSRRALMDGGSSFHGLDNFVRDSLA